MSDPQMKVLITADSTDLTQGLQKAGAAVKGVTQEMQGHIGGLEKALSGLMAPVAALIGAFAGGELFKGAVDGTIEWNVQAQKLKRSLGGTTEEASVLAVAIGDIHGNVEDFLAGSAKLTRTLNKNEEAVKKLGVETRDVNGHFRSTPELIADINARLGQFQEGTDRNSEAQKVYGKSYQEMLRYIKLTPEIMEEARQKAERLHLLVGPEGVAKSDAYRAALNEVNDVMESVKVRVGSELLPKLTELGVWFSQVGPPAIDLIVRGLQAVMNVLSLTAVQIGLAILVLRGPLTAVLSQAQAFGTAMVQIFQRVALGAQGPVSATASSLMGMVNPMTLVIAAVGAAVIGVEYWTRASSRAAEAQAELAAASLNNARSLDRWSAEALKNDAIIRSTRASAEEKAAAQDRLALIIEQMKQAYPGFNKFLVDEAGNQRSIADALKAQREEQIKLTNAKIADTKSELAKAQAELGSRTASAVAMGAAGGSLGNMFGAVQARRATDTAKSINILNGALKDLLDTQKSLRGEAGAEGDHSDGGDKSETELQRLKANLEAEKFSFEQRALAHGQFIEFSKAEEAKWLDENKSNYALNAKERLEVDHMTFQAKRAVMKQGFEGEIEGLKTSLEAAKLNGAERIRIAEEIAAKQATAYGEESKQAQAAAAEVIKVKREVANETRKLNEEILQNQRASDLAILDLDRIRLDDLARRGEISAVEEIRRLQALADAKFRIKEEELLEQISMDGRTKAEEEKLWGELEAIRAQHSAGMLQTKLELDAEFRKGDSMGGWAKGVRDWLKSASDSFATFRQTALSVIGGVQNAFATGIAGMLSGQMSLSKGMKAIWQGIVQTVIQAIAQLIARWIVMAVVKKALGVEEASTDGGRTAGALTTAAAETWAAYAGIPFYGPALALAQIALMYGSMTAAVGASAGIAGGVAATARAQGGRVDRPEFTLLGEAGPEIVAPESTFADYTRSILGLGASLGANLSSVDAEVMGYNRSAAGFARSRVNAQAEQAAPQYVDLRGAVIAGEGLESKRQIAELVQRGQVYYQRVFA